MPPGKAALLFCSSVKYFLYFPSYTILPPLFSSFLLPPTMTLKALLYPHLYIFFPFSAPLKPACNIYRRGRLRLTNWWSFVEVRDQQSWRKDNDRARNDFHYTGTLLPGLCINPWLSLCCRRTQKQHTFTSVWNLNWTRPLLYSKMMAYQPTWPSNLPTQQRPIWQVSYVWWWRMKECKHNTSLVLSYKKARVSKK